MYSHPQLCPAPSNLSYGPELLLVPPLLTGDCGSPSVFLPSPQERGWGPCGETRDHYLQLVTHHGLSLKATFMQLFRLRSLFCLLQTEAQPVTSWGKPGFPYVRAPIQTPTQYNQLNALLLHEGAFPLCCHQGSLQNRTACVYNPCLQKVFGDLLTNMLNSSSSELYLRC